MKVPVRLLFLLILAVILALCAPAVHVQRQRVDPEEQRAKLVKQVPPVYPPLAKQARIQGTVKLEAIITLGGAISDLRGVSSKF